MDYSAIKLSEADIQNQTYKKYFGGGEQTWESRGAFQLYFLQKMGLKRSDRLLDVGCGPIRSGRHFINYLDCGNYCGIDINPDFIRVAEEIVAQDTSLRDKAPHLECIGNFNFDRLHGTFTYVLAFSVLNHCQLPARTVFLENISRVTTAESKIYLTHARWFEPGLFDQTQLRLQRIFRSPPEIAENLDIQCWGWPPKETIFPILELDAGRTPADSQNATSK